MRCVVLLVPFLLLALLPRPPADTDPLAAIAAPHSYSILKYEVDALGGKVASRLLLWIQGAYRDERQGRQVVLGFFQLRDEAARLRRQLSAAVAGARPAADIAPLQERLAELDRELERLRPYGEYVLEREVREALAREGLGGLFLGAPFLFPPVQVHFARLPHVLIISPRERIELRRTFLLDEGLSLPQMDEMEAQVARRNLSGLVERVGGVATYPAILSESASLESVLRSAAHEWTHHYLIFYPLGRSYWSGEAMTTINETVADIVGDEISQQVLQRHAEAPAASPAEGPARPPPGRRREGEFFREMRATRLQVDALLAQGKVEEAEQYMEQRRRFLAERGYYLRRLNQAYFAFHGSYADSPASVSPVGGQLAALRARSRSLGEFLQTIAQVGSVEDYRRLLAQAGVQ